MQLERQVAQMYAHFCVKPVWDMKVAADQEIVVLRKNISDMATTLDEKSQQAAQCPDLEARIKNFEKQLGNLESTESANKQLTKANETLRKSLHEELDALAAQYEKGVNVLKRVHQSELQQVIDHWPGDEKPEPV